MVEERARLLIRIPSSLKTRLTELASRERRSLNREIEFLLEQAVKLASEEKAHSGLRPKRSLTVRK